MEDLLADSAGALNAEPQKALLKYNSYGPHANLNMLTPLGYIQSSYPERFFCLISYEPIQLKINPCCLIFLHGKVGPQTRHEVHDD